MAAEKEIRSYFSDDGTAYAVLTPIWWRVQFGHRQWDAWNDLTVPKLPPGIIMRHYNLKSADGKRRRNFPASRTFGDVLVAVGTVVTLVNADGSTTNWTVVGRNAERYQPRKYAQKRR